MVSYERLWKTMEKKGISQYRLINHYKISAGQIGRMKKNMHVSTHTLEVFCNILQCPVEDIVEVILDPQELDGKEPSSAGSRTAGRTAAGARDAKKAEGVTGDKAPGKLASRSGVQGTVKPAAASGDKASGKPESRSGIQGTGKTAAVTGEKLAGKAEDRTGGKMAGKSPTGSREGNK